MIPSRSMPRSLKIEPNGWLPIAVVATVGTTSTTSVDPVEAIAAICRRERIWLHVDAAYAGVAAMVPGIRVDPPRRGATPTRWSSTRTSGCSRRSTLSVLYCRRMDVRARGVLADARVPRRLARARTVRNLMDTGIQLGRRFRALKLWMVLRHFGADGLRDRLGEHMRLARLFARGSTRATSSSASRRCPSASSASAASGDDALNERLLDAVNRSGEMFLSHTRLDGRYTLRLAIGNLHTTERHVRARGSSSRTSA